MSSILEDLEDKSIICFQITEDNKRVVLTEANDCYYYTELSKEDFKKFLEELTEIYSQLV